MYTLYLTTRCNLNCFYCYENYTEKQDMDFRTSKNVIDFIFKNDMSDLIQIGFMGGEPLIKYDVLYYIVNYIKEYYPTRLVRYYITTNGVLLTEKIVRFLSLNNFDIRLSIDGDEYSTAINRMSKNISIYNKVVKNIRMLESLKCNYSLRMTVEKKLIDRLFNNIKYLYEKFNRPIDLQFDLNMSIDETNVLILKDQIRKIIAFYIEKNSNIDNPKLKIDQIDGKYLNILADFKNMFGMCDAGINSFNFMPDGNVYPCSFLTNLKEFCIGDIYNGISIEKSRELAIKNFDINKNRCSNCQIMFFCHGMKCGYLNYICTGKINVPSELTCQIEKTFYEELIYILEYFLKENKKINHLSEQFNNIINFIESNNMDLSYLGKKVKNKLQESIYENRCD